MKTWFSIKALADGDTADIAIFDEIGMWGVTAKDFISELKAQKGKKINCQINSPGGSVFDALAIYNALRNHGSDITIKVMGIAASAASLIAMAGDKIIMPENTFMMIHNPIGAVYGNAEDMRDLADTLDKIGSSLVNTYVARTGMDEDKIKDLLADETWLSAEEAVGMGFADELEPALKIAASFEIGRLPDNIKAAFEGKETPAPAASADDAGDNGSDAAAGSPEAEQVEEPADPFADQVSAIVTAAGLSDHLGVFLLGKEFDTLEKVKDAVANAREVRALCVAAKQPDMAAKMIRDKVALADARTRLCDVLADKDEASHTSNIIPSSNSKPAKVAQPAALKTADIWAARRLH